jgi:hypothetical protein
MQEMHSIKYESYNVIHGINFYMFWHQGVIFRGSTKTKEHKFNTPIQVLIALTVIIKILKYYNSRIPNADKLKSIML